MPPKAKITKEMIIAAAISVIRENGSENLNIRAIAEKLNCSTQPVMYYFKKSDDIRKAAYENADAFHSEYIMNIKDGNPMLGIGLNYIRFAAEEKNLFRFLFQSNSFIGQNMGEITAAEDASPITAVFADEAELSFEQAGQIFRLLFVYVHGYASMLANNSVSYSEADIKADLELIFKGLMAGMKGE